MEAFSLLKYWRTSGGGASADVTTTTTKLVSAVETADVECSDDGPFFDLEFAVPDEDDVAEEEDEEDEGSGHASDDNVSTCAEDGDGDGESDGGVTDGEGHDEFNFTVSSGSSNDRSDQNLALSPSDDLFFKGRLEPAASNGANKPPPPQFPVSLLKSATKFRVMMLGFKKSKTEKTEPASPKQEKKLFTVKLKVEEVPIVSLFTRDNSTARTSSAKKAPPTTATEEVVVSSTSTSDEKLFSKEVMQKYLKKVKPLYVRVSRRYGDKLRFSGQLSLGNGGAKAAPATEEAKSSQVEGNVKSVRQGNNNIPAGLRVVCKHLGKSRSASSAVAADPPVSKRRDDSLLQQQDGIQSAILHCKRSFNASRDSESCDVGVERCVSESGKDKEKPSSGESDDQSRKSFKEEEREMVA